MAATVEVIVFNGAGATETIITSATVRMKRADNNALDELNPVPIPTAGFNFSFRKNFRIRIDVSPDNNIQNLRFFSDGASLGTGREILFLQSASYVQGSGADESAAISAVNVDTHTSGSPKVINGGTVISNPATGFGTQDFVQLQMQLSSSALVGDPVAAKGLIYRFDEV